jgi:hypothetical protein
VSERRSTGKVGCDMGHPIRLNEAPRLADPGAIVTHRTALEAARYNIYAMCILLKVRFRRRIEIKGRAWLHFLWLSHRVRREFGR